ncbi:MAG: response regulator [Thermoguttaceae bacterium]
MQHLKNILLNLAAAGYITLPGDLSNEDVSKQIAILSRFAEYARTNSEMLRVELFTADPKRVERQLLVIKNELHICNASKLENDCDYILKHLLVRGPEYCAMLAEKLISDIIAFSIAIQMAQHQVKKNIALKKYVEPEEQMRRNLLAQLQQSLEKFDDEKSFDIITKLEHLGLAKKLEQIKSCISSFEFDKALRALNDFKSGTLSDTSVKKRIVLAVDDMPQNLSMLKAIIGDKCKFVGVTSGDAALKYIETNIPDVYILDIDMPKMNGFELVEAIRAKRKIAPIIFLTANATAEYVTKAFEMGITDFLVKPSNEEAVFAKLESVFSSSQ